MSGALPRIDVCVATWRRPVLLARLLRSLQAQQTDGRLDVVVHVVDNDPEGSARAVVEMCTGPVPVDYATQPQRSISVTRNRALARARGDWVALVDDDGRASARWLAHLLETALRYGADVVHGPQVPSFHPQVPRVLRASGLYHLPSPPTGTARGLVQSAGNALIRRAALERLDHWFDPAFGLTGGEDTELFGRLAQAGARAVWCREAVVWEHVPPERGWRWLARRRFRAGNSDMRVQLLHHPLRTRAATPVHVARFGWRAAWLPLRAASAPVDPRPLLVQAGEVLYQMGALATLLGVRFEEYGDP